LLEAVLQRRVVQQRHVASQHPRNLGVDIIALLVQFRHALGRVGLAAFAHLLEQIEQRQQTRFGADELPLGQLRQPGDRLLGGRRQVELRLVRARTVELAQPALVGRGPVVQVFQCRFGECGFAQVQAQGVQLVFQRLGQIRRRHHPHIGYHEHPMQKARHQRRMIRTQQPPRGVVGAQGVEGGEVEGHGRATLQRYFVKIT